MSALLTAQEITVARGFAQRSAVRATGLVDKFPDFDNSWPEKQKLAWLEMFNKVLATLSRRSPMALERRPAYWTFDEKADAKHGIRAYYFAPENRTDPPYREQREVTAILDIASDGTLAGVELVMSELPPPPLPASGAGKEEIGNG